MNTFGESAFTGLFPALREILDWADQEVARESPRCEASGKCCRFREYGHRLYLSQMEARLLLEGAPPHPIPSDERGCPYQINGLCTRREERPLGCRVYFCDPNFSNSMERIMEEGIRRLKELADLHQIGWDYASLHAFLDNPARAGLIETPFRTAGITEATKTCESTRQSLPLVS